MKKFLFYSILVLISPACFATTFTASGEVTKFYYSEPVAAEARMWESVFFTCTQDNHFSSYLPIRVSEVTFSDNKTLNIITASAQFKCVDPSGRELELR